MSVTSSVTTLLCEPCDRDWSRASLAICTKCTTRRQGPFPGRIADVGVVKDLATHDLDLTAWVTQLDYEKVAARSLHKSGRPHEDMIAIVALLGESVIANHLVNWLSPFKERITVVTGERGCFVADTLTADLTFHENSSVHDGVGRAC